VHLPRTAPAPRDNPTMALRRSLMGMAKVGDGGPRVDQTLSERSTPARRTNLTAALSSSSLQFRHPLRVCLSTIPMACTQRRLQATRLRSTRAPICHRARPRIRYRWIGAIGVCRTCSRRTLGPLVTSCSGTGFTRMKDPAPPVSGMSCSESLDHPPSSFSMRWSISGRPCAAPHRS
jgi:hypothetical protein